MKKSLELKRKIIKEAINDTLRFFSANDLKEKYFDKLVSDEDFTENANDWQAKLLISGNKLTLGVFTPYSHGQQGFYWQKRTFERLEDYVAYTIAPSLDDIVRLKMFHILREGYAEQSKQTFFQSLFSKPKIDLKNTDLLRKTLLENLENVRDEYFKSEEFQKHIKAFENVRD
tara:strand:+ start:1481 stop:1999 length:519 start_codon:yes stop_codon:yes gene_type:complete